MPALLACDYIARTVRTLEGLQESYARRARTAERFAKHAAEVHDKDTADHFMREAAIWRDAIDQLAETIQREQGR